jgi:Arc/MetJ family transcription regulator
VATSRSSPKEVDVAKKVIDIDEDNLSRASEVLGAGTMKETVNQALAEVIRLAERRAHARRLADMDGLDLDDGAVMADAWR